MDDDDEKNEAEESDPLTLTDLDAGRILGISMVFGSGQAVKMRISDKWLKEKHFQPFALKQRTIFFYSEPDWTLGKGVKFRSQWIILIQVRALENPRAEADQARQGGRLVDTWCWELGPRFQEVVPWKFNSWLQRCT